MKTKTTFLTLTLTSILLLGSTTMGAGFESLAHHWNFDEGPDWHDDAFQTVATATVAKDVVGSANATLQGMTGSAFVSGRQYTGLAFDGANDSLLTAASVAPVLGGTSSLSFWLKTTQSGAATAATAPGLLGSSGVQWGWIDDAGKIVLSVDGTVVVRSATALNDGLWHHAVLTRDATTGATQVFVDGVLSTSGTGATGIRSATITRIGHMQNGSAALFQGTLDQIHAFSGVVDAATIAALFDNHAPKTWVVNSDGETSAPFSTDSVLVSTYAYDAEQDALSVASFTQPSHGSVVLNGDGSFTYTATGGYIGADAFTATITDGRGGFTENTVNLVVTAPPAPEVANRTTTFTDFQAIQAGGVDIALSGWRVPRALDWNNDGDQDLLIGDDTGIWRYDNTGTPTAPTFASGVRVQAAGVDISLSGSILIALADMTGDGVDDLVAVGGDRKIRVYRNTSAAGQVPVYAAATVAQSTDGGDFVLPDQRFDAADWDGDGLVDLVMGESSGELRAYRNVGTAADPLYDPADYEVIESGSYNLYPRVFDINLNGTLDYLRGINWGGAIKFWFDPSRYTGLGNQSGELTITYAGGGSINMQPLTDGPMVDFADFNNDGVLDILIGGHIGSGTYLAFGVANTVADSIAAIEAIYDATYTNSLGAALDENSQALLNEINGHESNIIMHMGAATLTERQTMFTQMGTHVGNYAFLQMDAPADTNQYHHLPSIAGQNLMTMHEMLPDTPGHRIAVADAVGLVGVHRDIYLQMGLHVGDNQKASQGQIESVRDFMILQPRESFPDAMITLNHYYGDGRGGHINSFRGAKNTFNWGEGDNSSEWDGDLQTAIRSFYGEEVDRGDDFTFVMGHEVTHSLDGYVTGRANADLWRRKGQWLTLAAGPDVLSASGDNHDWKDWAVTKARFQAEGHWDGNSATWDAAWDAYWATGPGSVFKGVATMRLDILFFLNAPQEAMATQANQHWVHAEGRLIGAIDRWQRGVEQGIEPMKANITEVLTFLDWISCGMNKIVMQDTEGVSSPYAHAEYHTTHAWLERNDKGYITKVTTSGRTYEFELDEFGIVTGLISTPAFQQDDEVVVIQNTPNLIKPLENDQSNGDALGIDSFTLPIHGTLIDEGDGILVYTPDTGYTGADSFTYSTGPGIPASTVSISVMPSSTSQSGILMETWTGISGGSVSDLTGSANYPFSPNASEVRTSFEAPSNRGADFGTRMRALLIPPTTGDYTFWIASDDSSQLWLSSDRSAANKTQIAYVSGWTGDHVWTNKTSQQSATITLQAGTPYYIEALHKESSGGDHLAVAWQGPGMGTTNVISSTYLKTVDLRPPVVDNPITDIVVVQGAPDTILDLSSVFSDPDLQDTVGLSVDGNTNSSLVGATLVGTQLTLAYAPGQSGASEITIRAADLGGAIVTGTFTVIVKPDTDGDGMPDDWEIARGLHPLVDDASGHSDSDIFNNWFEYVSDTDPLDGDSWQTFSFEIDPGTGNPTTRFSTSASRFYAVEFRDDLTSGSWADLGSVVLGTGSEMTVSDPAASAQRYYRVRIELP